MKRFTGMLREIWVSGLSMLNHVPLQHTYNGLLFTGYLEVSDTSIKAGPKVDANEWGELIRHYWAVLLVVILTLLLVVLMPIIG